MRLLLRISDGIDRVNGLLGRLVAWLAVLMILIGAGNAILRYLSRFVGANLTSNAFIEAQWYLFSGIFLLGAGWALERDAHVRVDVIYGQFGSQARAAIDLAGHLLLLIPFCAFAIWVCWPAVAESWRIGEQSIDPGGLPRYPVKALIIVGFYLLLFQGIAEAIKRTAELLQPKERP
jgi:TRAP-type mannitol/chloroaromatic compound transport system permease small subunit